MKLIEFEESFYFLNKFKNFKFYFFEFYTRLCFLFLLICSLFFVSWEYRNEITVFLLMFQKNILTNQTFLVSNEFFEILNFNILLCVSVTFNGFVLGGIFHFFYFILPGLYTHEVGLIQNIFVFEVILILSTPFILIFIYIPFFWSFILLLQNITNDIGFNHIIELKSNFFINTLLYIYINHFVLSQCLLLFCLLFWINHKMIIVFFMYRKSFYFCLLFLSTLITPPDIFSQILFTFFSIFICELICFLFCFSIKQNKLIHK